MFVYLPGHKSHSIFVTPAADERGQPLDGVSQFKTPNGEPIQYNVRFVDGRAEVDATLGRWLVERGHARRTRLVLPQDLKRVG
jgi:hypothetical protein